MRRRGIAAASHSRLTRGDRTRTTVLLLTLGLLVVLMLPAEASATSAWNVKNASGKVIGKVKRVSSKGFAVYKLSGVSCGWVREPEDFFTYWVATMGLPGDTGARKYAKIFIGTKYVPWETLVSQYPESPIGRVVRRDGRWVAQWDPDRDFENWKKRGSVSGRCESWVALGAVFVLDSKWQ